MVIILFGLAGVGKTYAGEVLSQKYGFHFVDGDAWLTDDMRNVIAKKSNFTQEMIDEFTNVIIANIKALKDRGVNNIIFSQALYRQKNRKQIMKSIADVNFVQVNAKDEVIEKRILSRGNTVNLAFARSFQEYFQPMPNVCIINNNSDGQDEILKEFAGLGLL